MKKILTLALTTTLIASSIITTFADTTVGALKTFSDINTHWSLQYVSPLTQMGIIGGYPDGTFKPDSSIKRIEYIVLTLKALEKENLVTLRASAQGEYWGMPYLEKAIELGLINTTLLNVKSADFETPIKREEMASIIVRTNTLMSEQTILSEGVMEKSTRLIKDLTNVTKKYKTEVTQAYALNFLGGYPDGTFRPEGNATRAESSVMISKLLDPSMRTPIIEDAPLTGDETWIDWVKAQPQEYRDKYLVEEHMTSTFEDGILTIGDNDGYGTLTIRDDYIPDQTARLNNLLSYMVKIGRFSDLKNGRHYIDQNFGEIETTNVRLSKYENGTPYFGYKLYNDSYLNAETYQTSRTEHGVTMFLTVNWLSDSNTVYTDEFKKTRIDQRYGDLLMGSTKAFFGEATGTKIGNYLLQEYTTYNLARNKYVCGSETIDGITITVPKYVEEDQGSIEFFFTFEK